MLRRFVTFLIIYVLVPVAVWVALIQLTYTGVDLYLASRAKTPEIQRLNTSTSNL